MPKTKASFFMIAATLITVVVLFVLPITPKIPVTTAVIQRGDLMIHQSLEGVIGFSDEQWCLSPLEGQVAQIYVRQGQTVGQGEALLKLDSRAEEQALQQLEQALYGQEQTLQAVQGPQEALRAAFAQGQLAVEQKRQELLLRIEAKTVRAARSGTVGQVYATQGAYVAQATPVCNLRGDRAEIWASQRVQESSNLQVGMRALVTVGSRQVLSTLSGFDPPQRDVATGLYMQTLHFRVEEDGSWLMGRVGESVEIELITRVEQAVALAPLAAISADNSLWILKGDQVTAAQVDPQQRNEDFVRVPEAWIGEKVVLLPDEAALYAGCMVKESK